jgi:hypothetical protein
MREKAGATYEFIGTLIIDRERTKPAALRKVLPQLRTAREKTMHHYGENNALLWRKHRTTMEKTPHSRYTHTQHSLRTHATHLCTALMHRTHAPQSHTTLTHRTRKTRHSRTALTALRGSKQVFRSRENVSR